MIADTNSRGSARGHVEQQFQTGDGPMPIGATHQLASNCRRLTRWVTAAGTTSQSEGLMRFIQAVIFLAFLGAVGVFAVQNTDLITVRFWTWTITGPVAIVAIALYLLGMLSGWTVVAFVRRSLRRVSEGPRD